LPGGKRFFARNAHRSLFGRFLEEGKALGFFFDFIAIYFFGIFWINFEFLKTQNLEFFAWRQAVFCSECSQESIWKVSGRGQGAGIFL
jgi:hypothetical protein